MWNFINFASILALGIVTRAQNVQNLNDTELIVGTQIGGSLETSPSPLTAVTVNPHAQPQHVTRGPNKGLVKSYENCFGMSPEFHGKDKHCVFPFIYRGIVYDNCTYVADSQPWCATATDDNGHLVTNDWGYCTAACPVMPHTHCQTVQGGPIQGAFCRFPFRYRDVEYNMCTNVDHVLTPEAIEAGINSTQGWCATKVDAHGDYVPHHWGICQPECRPPKTEKSTTQTSTQSLSSLSTTSPVTSVSTTTTEMDMGGSTSSPSTSSSTSTRASDFGSSPMGGSGEPTESTSSTEPSDSTDSTSLTSTNEPSTDLGSTAGTTDRTDSSGNSSTMPMSTRPSTTTGEPTEPTSPTEPSASTGSTDTTSSTTDLGSTTGITDTTDSSGPSSTMTLSPSPSTTSDPNNSTPSTSTSMSTASSSVTASSLSPSTTPPQVHIPSEQLPVLIDIATYIPLLYSDPIVSILEARGVDLTS